MHSVAPGAVDQWSVFGDDCVAKMIVHAHAQNMPVIAIAFPVTTGSEGYRRADGALPANAGGGDPSRTIVR